ncbi:hypothetical protein SOV_42860 [Sporomusa ovata DSM 2662]|uniref:CRISPR-associated protein Cas5 n=1 Tax=Sporomusa ovata TaxID=2378 RepID=A0A0U1KTQ0_9FIRM|nr:CRISPR-associated protein Cas5 [Sporomusa ovata]EQB26674.1 CRISPR-associated protein Cas5 [Sporomusa ovata DSM 2662]CQR70767.1 hypothetical protein SpAn4DRAFT_1745 [Sporomusa ovata]
MKVLRISLQAQTAHYRIPFTQLRYRQSYPLPPYSTVIGLMMNIIGEQERIDEFLSKQFGVFVSGKFGVISQEYVWYRNLHKKEQETNDLTIYPAGAAAPLACPAYCRYDTHKSPTEHH